MSAGRRCHSCDRPLRRGSSRRALVGASDGSVTYAIVCNRCRLRAIAFIVPPPTQVPTLCAECKRGHGSVCRGCVDRLRESVRELTAANVLLTERLKARVWPADTDDDETSEIVPS